jgi:hypothetical protein
MLTEQKNGKVISEFENILSKGSKSKHNLKSTNCDQRDELHRSILKIK